jgi:uncharacterized membrane protein
MKKVLTFIAVAMLSISMAFTQNAEIMVTHDNMTDVSLMPDATDTRTITIVNTGNRPLEWKIMAKGETVDFVKPDWGDPMLMENQDHIIYNVWITRDYEEGLFNAASETSYSSSYSPEGTEWAYGTSDTITPDRYTNWEDAVYPPPSQVSNIVSLFIPASETFYDLDFHNWNQWGYGGSFSYTRVEYPDWITFDMSEGVLPIGDTAVVTVTFDATGEPYMNMAHVYIMSNDPMSPELMLEAQMMVSDRMPEAYAVNDEYSIDGVTYGESATIPVYISNAGLAPLEVTDVFSNTDQLSVDQTSFTIEPFKRGMVMLTFTPDSIFNGSFELSFENNDTTPDNDTLVYTINVSSMDSVGGMISETELSTTIPSNTMDTLYFTVTNASDSEQDMSIKLAPMGDAVYFLRDDFVDPDLPENQDHISDNVAITRGITMGIYNAMIESGYDNDNYTSPIGTEWSEFATEFSFDGDYGTWYDSHDQNPPGLIGRTVSMLVEETGKHYNVDFKKWSVGGAGGGFAYERYEVANWLKFESETFSISPTSDSTYMVLVNSDGLEPGDYSASFYVNTMFTGYGMHMITVNITVTEKPEIMVASNYDFGYGYQGYPQTNQVSISNEGTGTLSISDISNNLSVFTLSETTFDVAPGETHMLEVTFEPDAIATFEDTLFIESNDPEMPMVEVAIVADGVEIPGFEIDTLQIVDTLMAGTSSVVPVTISNDGGGILNWSMVLEGMDTVMFEKANFANWELPENQDRVAEDLWITRANTEALFNAFDQTEYDYDGPTNSGWVFDQTLLADPGDYEGFIPSIGGGPQQVIGKYMSMRHETSGMIYNVMFSKYSGGGPGGGFAYTRWMVPGWLKASSVDGSIDNVTNSNFDLLLDASDLVAGVYHANISVHSDDPTEMMLTLPITLRVTGIPDIAAMDLDFGTQYIGFPGMKYVNIENTGTDTLYVSEVFIDSVEFMVPDTSFMVLAGESFNLPVTFDAAMSGTYSGHLSIVSNAVSEDTLVVNLMAEALEAPAFAINQTDFENFLVEGEDTTYTLTIENNGQSDLMFNIGVGELNIENLHELFDNDYQRLLSALSDHYVWLWDGGSNNIGDGGGDMYDNGNYINTDLATQIDYTSGTVEDGTGIFGDGTSFFTVEKDGFFGLAAELDSISSFYISGNNGADGGGATDTYTTGFAYAGSYYDVFVKRVYNAGDPSINHITIIENTAGAEIVHTPAASTDNDLDEFTNIDSSRFLVYMLVSKQSGGFVSNEEIDAMLDEFKFSPQLGAPWITFDTLSGTIAPSSSMDVMATVSAVRLPDGDYMETIDLTTNDPANMLNPLNFMLHVGGFAVVQNPIEDQVLAEGFGALAIEYNNAFYYNFAGDPEYTVFSNNEDVVTVVLNGTDIELTEVGYGEALITLQISDGGINTAYLDFNVTVNGAPMVANTIDPVSLDEGFGTYTIDISEVFSDPELDELTYSIVSDNPSLVDLSEDADVITITETENFGTATVTITAADANNDVSTTFDLAVNQLYYNVTFTVVDDLSNALEGVEISFDGGTLTTDASGVATTTALNGTYAYTAMLAGYEDAVGEITVADSDVAENVTMATKYNVTFTVVDIDSNPLVDVAIDFDGGTLTTDASGMASAMVVNGTYAYTATLANYNSAIGEVVVAGTDVTETITMSPVGIGTFNLTDVVTYPNPFSNELTIDGLNNVQQVALLNVLGEVVYNAVPSSEKFVISTEGLAGGIYMLRILDNSGENHLMKVIKE